MSASQPSHSLRLGHFPVLPVMFSVGLSVLILGIFTLILFYAGRFSAIVSENISLQVYLQHNLQESEKIKINQILNNKPYVQQRNGQPRVEFVSKEDAAEKFISQTGEDFTQFLGDNPLRDAFVVYLPVAYQNEGKVKPIKEELSAIDGVFEVVYFDQYIELVNKNVRSVGLILLAIFGVLCMAVVLLIYNSLKLALFSQRFIIRSMQLVGATDAFIRKPFVVRAVWAGVMAGAIAAVLVGIAAYFINQTIDGLQYVATGLQVGLILILLPISGAIITFLSTFTATNKFLGMSLDQLN